MFFKLFVADSQCCEVFFIDVHFFQGTILDLVSLPTLGPGSLTRSMLKWRHMVSDFEQVDDECEQITSLISFSRCLFEYVHGQIQKAKSEDATTESAVSIQDWSSAMGIMASSRGLKLMLDNPKAAWETEKMLVECHMPLAQIMLSIDDKKVDVERMKDSMALKDVAVKLHTCESVAAALSLDLIEKEPLFQEVKAVCEDYQRGFTSAAFTALKTLQATHVKSLSDFIKRYKPFVQKAKDWCMESTEKYFDTKAKEDINKFANQSRQIAEELPNIKQLRDHSGSEATKSIVDFAGEVSVQLGQKAKECQEIASLMLYSAYFIVPEDDVTMQDVVDYCKMGFNFNKSDLPGKLANMVDEELKKAKSGSDVAPAHEPKKRKSSSGKDNADPKAKKEKKSSKTEKEARKEKKQKN